MIAAASAALVPSQREVARRLGVSHTALQKAAQSGRIAQEPGGGWDVDKVRAQLAASSDPVRKTAPMVAPAPAQPSPPPTTPRPFVAPPMPEPLPTPSAGGSSFHNARTANEMLKAQEKLLAMRPNYIVVPGKWAEIDAYGNVAMGMMRAIMAQLNLRRTVSSPGRAQTRRRGARRREDYFIVPVGRTKATHPETSHLPPGIYRVAATGAAPLLVLAFVRQGGNSYKVRYDFNRLGAASVERHLPGLLQRALTEFPPRRR